MTPEGVKDHVKQMRNIRTITLSRPSYIRLVVLSRLAINSENLSYSSTCYWIIRKF